MDEPGVDVPYARGVWGNRQPSQDATAAGLLALLAELTGLDPALSSWALEQHAALPHDVEGVAALLAQQAAGGRPDEPWRVTVTSTAEPSRAVSVTVRDGNRKTHPIYLNEVVVEPTPTATDRSLFTRHGHELVGALVRLWQPDVVTLADLRLQRAQTSARRRPPVGALTWFADTCGQVPDVLPEGAGTYRLQAGTAVDLLGEDGGFPAPERVAEVAGWLDRTGVRDALPQVQRSVVG